VHKLSLSWNLQGPLFFGSYSGADIHIWEYKGKKRFRQIQNCFLFLSLCSGAECFQERERGLLLNRILNNSLLLLLLLLGSCMLSLCACVYAAAANCTPEARTNQFKALVFFMLRADFSVSLLCLNGIQQSQQSLSRAWGSTPLKHMRAFSNLLVVCPLVYVNIFACAPFTLLHV